MLGKLSLALVLLPALAFAQSDSQSKLVEALVLLAIVFVMAGVPMYRKYVR